MPGAELSGPGAELSDLASRFEADGFVRGGAVLDDGRVDELRDELERVIRDRDAPGARKPVRIVNLSRDDEAPVWQIVNIWQASDAFERLLHEPVVADGLRELAGGPVRVWHDQIQYKPAAVGGVNHWHQDKPYWPCLGNGRQVTAWVALDDADESNGCMCMVPGSQRWGDQIRFLHTVRPIERMPSEWEGRTLEVRSCPVPKGWVHFHDAFTWHGSGANASGRPRRAIAIHAMDAGTRFAGRRGHPMEPLITVDEGAPLAGDAFPLLGF